MKSKLLLIILSFFLTNVECKTQNTACIESLTKEEFVKVVNECLVNNRNIVFCDTTLFIKKLLQEFYNDNSHCDFGFLKMDKPLNGLLNTVYDPENGYVMRRKDFGVLIYVHYFIIQRDEFDKNKAFFISHQKEYILGKWVFDSGRDERRDLKDESKKMKRIYKKMIFWIKYVKKNNLSLNSEKAKKTYPFNYEYNWVNR